MKKLENLLEGGSSQRFKVGTDEFVIVNELDWYNASSSEYILDILLKKGVITDTQLLEADRDVKELE
jgi:hypothetical protein